jgi:precorrin-2 methylase
MFENFPFVPGVTEVAQIAGKHLWFVEMKESVLAPCRRSNRLRTAKLKSNEIIIFALSIARQTVSEYAHKQRLEIY